MTNTLLNSFVSIATVGIIGSGKMGRFRIQAIEADERGRISRVYDIVRPENPLHPVDLSARGPVRADAVTGARR